MLSLKAFWSVRAPLVYYDATKKPDEGHAIPSVAYCIYLSIGFGLLLISYYII